MENHKREVVEYRRTKANSSPLLAGDGKQQLPSPSLAIIFEN